MTATEIMQQLFDAAIENEEFVVVGETESGVILFETAD